MATAWFFCPYARRDPRPGMVGRYCVMDDFSPQIITQDGGDWRESEGLGNYAIVKVRASVATLQAIAADVRIDHIPLSLLDDPTSTLTAAQQTAIQNRLLAMGFTAAELLARFPGGFAGPYTLRDVLRYAVSRRLTPRYDVPTDTIVLNGAPAPTTPPEALDTAVT